MRLPASRTGGWHVACLRYRLEVGVTDLKKTPEASRRELLKLGVFAAAAALLPASPLLAGSGPLYRVPVDKENDSALLYRSTFASQLNQPFRIRQTSGRLTVRSLTLTLVDVTDVPTAAAAGTEGREDCFTAVFKGAVRSPLGQRTYTVTNPGLGRFELFLVPAGGTRYERLYTATFNRVLPS